MTGELRQWNDRREKKEKRHAQGIKLIVTHLFLTQDSGHEAMNNESASIP